MFETEVSKSLESSFFQAEVGMSELTRERLQDILVDLDNESAEQLVRLYNDRELLQDRAVTLANNLSSEVEAKVKALVDLGRHKSIYEKTAQLEKRERDYEVNTLKLKLECQEKINSSIMELVRTVFKNPMVKETVYSNRSEMYIPPGSSYPSSFSIPENSTKVVETE